MSGKMLKRVFNVGSHVGSGMWIANGLNDPKYRVGVAGLLALVTLYQVQSAWKKGDGGYEEMKEIAVGMFAVLAAKRAMDWWNSRRGDRD